MSSWQAVRAHRGELRARQALEVLQAGAPAFAAQAQMLAGQRRFAEAVEKLDFALRLRPDAPGYLLAKANLLQSQLRFAEAAPVYAAVLRLDSRSAPAQTNLHLSTLLGRLDPAARGWEDLLNALYIAMTQEQRPAPEVQPVADVALDRVRRRLADWMGQDGRPVAEVLRQWPGGLLRLELAGTRIADLGPVRGLPLSRLGLAGSAVTDLRPLAGLPLHSFDAAQTDVADLEPLRSLPLLQHLALEQTLVTNLAPLAGSQVSWLNLIHTGVTDLAPLRGLPLLVLRIGGTPVTNLAPLAGLRIEELDCGFIPATDFGPLAACTNLAILNLHGTRIRPLEPLRGLGLRHLTLTRTPVRDLAPLAGMPLESLALFDTEVTDVSPLLHCPRLRSLGLPRGATNTELLRALPNLAEVSDAPDGLGRPALTAEEFWSVLDEAKRSGP